MVATIAQGLDVHALLDLAVQMHDHEARSVVGVDQPAPPDLAVLESRATLDDLLISLDRERERETALLASFVLDNYVQATIFSAVGADDSTTDDEILLERLRGEKDRLARELGDASYMDLYMRTRQYDRASTLAFAEHVLEATRGAYEHGFRLCRFNVGMTRDAFDRSYRRFLHANVANFPFERLFEHLREHLDRTFAGTLNDRIELRAVDEEIVSTAASDLRERRSWILSSRMSGYEQFKAGFHGLGHSLFAVLNEAEPSWALPTDIALTESLAFLFQSVPASPWWTEERAHVARTFPGRARLYELYFQRMYAAQTLFEEWYYSSEPSLDIARARLRALRREHLFVEEPSTLRLGVEYRPLCVEFLYAFALMDAVRDTLADQEAWWGGRGNDLLRAVYARANASTPPQALASLRSGHAS